MNGKKRISIWLALVALLLLTLPVLAQSGGGYTFSSGGSYTLGGTIGQPDAGTLSGGSYTLGGGFWGGGQTSSTAYSIYLPLVLRNAP